MPAATPIRHALVADIGGTNTRVGMAQGTQIDPATVRRFRNADHAGLEPVLRLYMEQQGVARCDGACVAVAGPVRDGVGSLTNLDWTLDTQTLAQATGASQAALVNDLQAQGYALAGLAPGHLQQILPGPIHGNQARLVIGVGTGFNVAPVVPVPFGAPGAVVVPAAEHGHVVLPVRSQADADLSAHLHKDRDFVSVEDVLSGRGLERIYAFHAGKTGQAPLPAADIMHALGQNDPLARATAQDFLRVLGTVAGDLALAHLPFDGLYLVGGVARAFGQYLQNGAFAAAFADKGRFADFMANFPVFLVLDDYAALSGAAAYLNLSANS